MYIYISLLDSYDIITHMLRIEAHSLAMSQHGHFMERQPVKVTTLANCGTKCSIDWYQKDPKSVNGSVRKWGIPTNNASNLKSVIHN